MDLLYIIGTGSKLNNIELRFSLRSLEKYGKNIDNIYVVGEYPEFLTDNVNCIYCEDKFGSDPINKHKNILYKIEYAVLHSDISDEFLTLSDDYFFFKETDFNSIPYYRKRYNTNHKYINQLPDTDEYIRNDFYIDVLLKCSRKFLEKYNLPVHLFCHHYPHHFNKELFKEMIDIVHDSYLWEGGCEATCLMLNYQYSKRPFDFIDTSDVKYNSNKIDNFCITVNALEEFSDLMQILLKEFSSKSKYEKNEISVNDYFKYLI